MTNQSENERIDILSHEQWEQLEKDYHEVEALCKKRGINTLEQYVRAVLMMQR